MSKLVNCNWCGLSNDDKSTTFTFNSKCDCKLCDKCCNCNANYKYDDCTDEIISEDHSGIMTKCPNCDRPVCEEHLYESDDDYRSEDYDLCCWNCKSRANGDCGCENCEECGEYITEQCNDDLHENECTCKL